MPKLWLLLIVLAALVPLASAGQALSTPAPSYPDLLQQARISAPRLGEVQAQIESAEALKKQAAARPNPNLEFLSENLAAPKIDGMDQQQTTLTVSQVLELGGKRRARIAAAEADVDVAQARAHQAAADFAYELANAYITAEAAQARAELLADAVERARQDVRAAAARTVAGPAPVREAQAAAQAAEADLAGARADAAEALARLSSMVAAPEPYTEISSPLLPAAADLPEEEDPIPENAPAVQLAVAERHAAEHKVDIERSRASPDLTISLGARRLPGGTDTALVFGLSAPLPLFDRNDGARAAAAADFRAAEARVRASRLAFDADWRGAKVQAVAAQARLAAASQAVDSARKAYEAARAGLQTGRTSQADLETSRRSYDEAETRLLDARFARVHAETVLARLAGRAPFERRPKGS